ncbi:MAG: bifunctional oligoribonuclease/PAP phosphatase NrnA [Candidatus Abyssobacteria bacterium SURF_17]|uniref:Bifunctional oligoribonuclease/PAP phosphatase NrnA n=1 Tax=Candidatus Abyssobacteria bacterium SURF_17 TaxID=2093361 RepID=A0A419F9H9_9BACT|nr:MAG: bifunctional oligoribonuclease/PAP phosphatase NrnA [Candidatus Abyssubacteria bacterium SURF_17]
MNRRKTLAIGRKVAKLFKVLSGKERILIISHDNPDPDTLASAFALRDLVMRKLGADSIIAFSGIIGRAENRAMIKHLGIPLKRLEELDLSKFDATVLVDSQPHTGKLDLPEDIKLDVVIDHHPLHRESRRVEFHDIQSRIGATSTIITQYLMAEGTEIDSRIATALLYGIKSDTRDLGRETSKYDVEAYLYLYPRANLRLLSKIEYAEVPVEYFRVYEQAIDSALTFDGVVVSFIGKIDNPDMVAEMADMLIRLEGTRCALVGGHFEDGIYVSVRTKNSDLNAGKLVQRVIGKLGPSGGHGSMSAGRVKLGSQSDKEKESLEKTIIRRLKRAMKLKGVRARKLVE